MFWIFSNGNGCQIGLCGYGNQEFEIYSFNNFVIVNVFFELVMWVLVIIVCCEIVGSNQFIFGKIDLVGKVQVKYGMVEVCMVMFLVGVGLWLVMWMLGISLQIWLCNGEIDIMEQGGCQFVGVLVVLLDCFVGFNVIIY